MSCRILDWDSAFFGRHIARLDPLRVDAAAVEEALGWCRQRDVDCLYFLADSNDPETITAVERAGFNSVDIRMTYERALTGARFERPPRVREARDGDIAALEAIAAECHTDTRFFFDERFPRATASELYRTWIRQSCQQRDGQVLVLEDDATGTAPAGYIACEHRAGQPGQIGLVGLAAGARGRGGGSALVQGALAWFADRGVAQVLVVTQGRNVGAQRLYQKAGFLTRKVELWYHRWFDR